MRIKNNVFLGCRQCICGNETKQQVVYRFVVQGVHRCESDSHHHSSSGYDTMGILRHVDKVSFCTQHSDGQSLNPTHVGDWNFQTLTICIQPSLYICASVSQIKTMYFQNDVFLGNSQLGGGWIIRILVSADRRLLAKDPLRTLPKDHLGHGPLGQVGWG